MQAQRSYTVVASELVSDIIETQVRRDFHISILPA